MARSVVAGAVGINGFRPDVGAPFGGLKASGLGREYGPEALDEFSDIRSIYLPSPAQRARVAARLNRHRERPDGAPATPDHELTTRERPKGGGVSVLHAQRVALQTDARAGVAAAANRTVTAPAGRRCTRRQC